MKVINITTKSTSSGTKTVLKSIGTGNVTASSLNVRKVAFVGRNVIGIIKKGFKVNLYGIQGGFYKIMYNGQVGYICKSYVSLINTQLNKTQYIIEGQQYIATKSMDRQSNPPLIYFLKTLNFAGVVPPHIYGIPKKVFKYVTKGKRIVK